MKALLCTIAGALLNVGRDNVAGRRDHDLHSMGSLSGVTDLAAAYEQASGHKVGSRPDRAGAAQGADVQRAGRHRCELHRPFAALMKQGKVVDGSPVQFARAGVGVAIKKGAPKPDIGTVEAFKQTMLKAKSIGYSKSGSGLIAERGLQQLGIFDQVKDKVRYFQGTPVAVFVAKGEVEIGMQQSNAIVPVAGAEYAGPLPGDLQEYLYFSVGVLTISKQPDVARAFITFMASPDAAVHLRKSAMEPPGG